MIINNIFKLIQEMKTPEEAVSYIKDLIQQEIIPSGGWDRISNWFSTKFDIISWSKTSEFKDIAKDIGLETSQLSKLALRIQNGDSIDNLVKYVKTVQIRPTDYSQMIDNSLNSTTKGINSLISNMGNYANTHLSEEQKLIISQLESKAEDNIGFFPFLLIIFLSFALFRRRTSNV